MPERDMRALVLWRRSSAQGGLAMLTVILITAAFVLLLLAALAFGRR
jgi:hypothetical protein